MLSVNRIYSLLLDEKLWDKSFNFWSTKEQDFFLMHEYTKEQSIR